MWEDVQLCYQNRHNVFIRFDSPPPAAVAAWEREQMYLSAPLSLTH